MPKFEVNQKVQFKSRWNGLVTGFIDSIDDIQDNMQYYTIRPEKKNAAYPDKWGYVSEKKIEIVK